MCKYLLKVHLHTESYQDRFKNKKVFSCVPHLLWNRPWSNEVSKMSLFKAGSRNFAARTLIFEYFIVLLILSKSYYWHFSIRPFICMRDGLKDAESVPPYCGPLYIFFYGKQLHTQNWTYLARISLPKEIGLLHQQNCIHQAERCIKHQVFMLY